MPDPRIHRCKQDDNLAKIAAEYPEIDRSVILDAIRKLGRGDPNLLCEGDALELPFIEDKKDSKAQDASHPYGADAPRQVLNLRILEEDRKTPIANAPYTLTIEGETQPREGSTDADGRMIVEDIPAVASTAGLKVQIPALVEAGADHAELTWQLSLGGLNPILDKDLADDDPRLVLAVQQRLESLGLYSGPVDGILNAATKNAVREFRIAAALGDSDTIDQSLRSKLSLVNDGMGGLGGGGDE